MANHRRTDEGCELMLKVSRGDEHAFERLVMLFQKPVINTIHRYLGDADRAEDLAQEVFMKIYLARKRYKPLARFETWLHRIVYNVVINEAQSRRRRKMVSLDALPGNTVDGMGLVAENVFDPIEHIKREEIHEKVRQAISELPPNQRMAVILSKYEEMAYKDIALALDTSVEAVKSLLFRARDKIRLRLRQYIKSEVSK